MRAATCDAAEGIVYCPDPFIVHCPRYGSGRFARSSTHNVASRFGFIPKRARVAFARLVPLFFFPLLFPPLCTVYKAHSADAPFSRSVQDLPRGHTKTRRALAQVLAERSVLDSCGALWADFRAALFSDAGITIASSGAEHASRVSADARGALGVAGRTALGLLAEYASDEDGDGE